MARVLSKAAPDWWDYTTLDKEICQDAARLTPEDMLALSRDGFKVVFYDTLVNALELNLAKKEAHFWGMDEWVEDGKPVPVDHPLSFARADMELCFDRIAPVLQLRKSNVLFPSRMELSDDRNAVRYWLGGAGAD